MNAIMIRDVELPILEYQGKRVVTLAMVDKVHGRPEGAAKSSFHYNRERFADGEDYLELTGEEIHTRSLQGVFPPRTSRG